MDFLFIIDAFVLLNCVFTSTFSFFLLITKVRWSMCTNFLKPWLLTFSWYLQNVLLTFIHFSLHIKIDMFKKNSQFNPVDRNCFYHKVTISIMSRLVPLSRIFQLFRKGKFDANILWPLDKRVQNWIVDRSILLATLQ